MKTILIAFIANMFTCLVIAAEFKKTTQLVDERRNPQLLIDQQKGPVPYHDNRTFEDDKAFPIFRIPLINKRENNLINENNPKNPLMPQKSETLIGRAEEKCKAVTTDKNICIEKYIFEISQMDKYKNQDNKKYNLALLKCKNFLNTKDYFPCIKRMMNE